MVWSTRLGFKDIYSWKRCLCRFGPFLTISVRNGPSVSFGTNIPWITSVSLEKGKVKNPISVKGLWRTAENQEVHLKYDYFSFKIQIKIKKWTTSLIKVTVLLLGINYELVRKNKK